VQKASSDRDRDICRQEEVLYFYFFGFVLFVGAQDALVRGVGTDARHAAEAVLFLVRAADDQIALLYDHRILEFFLRAILRCSRQRAIEKGKGITKYRVDVSKQWMQCGLACACDWPIPVAIPMPASVSILVPVSNGRRR
jgi:hypothetical protein